jgi:hypothetical protein
MGPACQMMIKRSISQLPFSPRTEEVCIYLQPVSGLGCDSWTDAFAPPQMRNRTRCMVLILLRYVNKYLILRLLSHLVSLFCVTESDRAYIQLKCLRWQKHPVAVLYIVFVNHVGREMADPLPPDEIISSLWASINFEMIPKCIILAVE